MPSNITPNPAGTLTPIKPDGGDVLNAASIAEPLQRLANKDAAQDLEIAANKSVSCVLILDTDETADDGYMSFTLASGGVYPAGTGYTESGGVSLFVPSAGTYEASFYGEAKVVLAAGSSSFRAVKVEVIVRNTIDSSESVAGTASLIVHTDNNFVPEPLVGSGVLFTISDSSSRIVRLKAQTGSADWSIQPTGNCRVSVRRVGAIL